MKSWMLIVTVLASAAMIATGCAKDNKKPMTSSGVTDVTPSATASTPTYTPPPSVAAQPVVSETPTASAAPTAASDTSATASSSAIGATYKVKKGDTLYSIARAKYGDGKQWTKITGANPGLTPQTLKVGQTIHVP